MSVCGVCKHSKVHIINERLLSGVKSSVLASEFGFSKDQMFRHKGQHISGLVAKRVEYVDTAAANSIMEKIDVLLGRCEEIFIRNRNKGKDLICLRAISEQRSTFELLAKISVAMHAASEARLNRESEIIVIDQSQQFQQSLSVLTFAELEILQAITNKLEQQDKTIIILPDDIDFLPSLSPPFAADDKWQSSGSGSQNKPLSLKRTRPPKSEQMCVRPIDPTIIPG